MYSAGDGVHLGNAAYPALLNALCPLLDACLSRRHFRRWNSV
ncbi:MAG: hypothetical protein ACLTXT_04495 [Ruminococcus callidus]